MNICIICSRMYQDKLASLKRQLQQLHEGNHVLTRAAATSALLPSVLLSKLVDGQTQVQYETILSCAFLVIPFFKIFALQGLCRNTKGGWKSWTSSTKRGFEMQARPRKFHLCFHADASMLTLFTVCHYELGDFAALLCQAWVRE